MPEDLPLFPLGTVLAPGQGMNLQLFEPRYVRLHEDLMARPADQRRVGIVLITKGNEVGAGREVTFAQVGCEARVMTSASATRADTGTPLVAWQVLGARRFRVDALVAGTGLAEGEPGSVAPYLIGRVSWLDPEVVDQQSLTTHARAAAAGLSVRDRQRLLDTHDPAQRDRLAEQLIAQESALREHFGGVPAHEVPRGDSLN